VLILPLEPLENDLEGTHEVLKRVCTCGACIKYWQRPQDQRTEKFQPQHTDKGRVEYNFMNVGEKVVVRLNDSAK